MTRTYTHGGWFWLCPILFAEDGDGCIVESRYWWLEWLFSACEYAEAARINLSMAIWPDYEPSFAFRVYELDAPITLDGP